tara:strand:- start:1123 stop:1911 length:789 start_codon:yes stop_codon:yes gene_type:complete
MIAAETKGRLGNQMFIVATANSLALDNNDSAIFPEQVVCATLPTARETSIHRNTVLRNIKYTNDFSFVEHTFYETPDHSYIPIEYNNNIFLRGYFQSEKYFKHNRENILELFAPIPQIDTLLNKKYKDIIYKENVVSVHVRRGDYSKFSDYHANIGPDYYSQAMQQFPSDSTFVFFSDDIEWCKQTFKGERLIFIEKQDDVLDLYLMSKITNNIIANSSFSWWGAWLNSAENKKVIAPKIWFGPKNKHLNRKDITPEEWLTI